MPSRQPSSSGPPPRERTDTRAASKGAADPLASKEMQFDVAAEAMRLKGEDAYVSKGRNAITLVKYPDLRVVLTALSATTRIDGHKTEGRISIHALSGELRLHVAGRLVDLAAGRLLALDSGVAHDLEAVKDSVFLLTVALPGK